ncbi:FG-GAP-like repeat-containing protein [Actinokineospora globicatena]|uniref:Repeat domain-containing protein n=1 Tax=Actinokineospora globicatena TaxID=103729 RepID=A0A9W6QJB3_9PSEU|nr:FG-GAP-like repeat-containing protein [Actinokineospora globicatena]GLW90537.1 hypothetical protein Aglo03_13530 [Actinokineospora globicatena]
MSMYTRGAALVGIAATLALGVGNTASAAPVSDLSPTQVAASQTLTALPCVSGGPTAADTTTAATLNPLLNNKMSGNMNSYNASCARAVVDAVKAYGYNEKAAAIAISTVIVETSISNLDGGDRDSVGLYQQRDTWGTFAQRTDPVIATRKFLDEMNRLFPNGSWNTASIGWVAAEVQRPADAYRGRYAVEAADSVVIANKLWATRAPGASLSGDSRAELVHARTDGTLQGWYNGNGFMSTPWTSNIPVGVGFADPARVKFADLSGDGRKELIYVAPDGKLRAWYNGNGFTTYPWTSELEIGSGFSDPSRVFFADLSGDGRAELIHVETNGNLRGWYNGNGFTTAPWTSNIVIGTGFADPARVHFADLSGDGRAELVYNETNGDLRGWYNGNGFTAAPWTSNIVVGTGFTDPARTKFGDFSGDGRAEVVYVSPEGNLRAWYNGNGFTTMPWTGNEISIGSDFTDPARVIIA